MERSIRWQPNLGLVFSMCFDRLDKDDEMLGNKRMIIYSVSQN